MPSDKLPWEFYNYLILPGTYVPELFENRFENKPESESDLLKVLLKITC